MSNFDFEPGAVRWARRELKQSFGLDYSKWHWTEDGDTTLCGVKVPLGLEGTFFPEMDELPERVTCRRCRKALGKS